MITHATALNNDDSPRAAAEGLAINQAADDALPEWIDLLPKGTRVTGRDGRTWLNDKQPELIRAFTEGEADLPIDIEHATEHKARKGEPAPAVGWIKALRLSEGRIQGQVEWTARGAEAIRNREYRYISPVFHFDKSSGRILRLLSVGLTNQPNLKLSALNQSQITNTNTPIMDKEQFIALCRALGLDTENTTPEVAINAAQSLKSDHATALNRAEHPAPDKFVPRADYDTAINRASKAEDDLRKHHESARNAQVDALLDEAVKAGKVAPASKDHYKALCNSEEGMTSVKALIDNAPVIGDPQKGFEGSPPAAKASALNATEKTLCDQMGISHEDYLKTKQEDAAASAV